MGVTCGNVTAPGWTLPLRTALAAPHLVGSLVGLRPCEEAGWEPWAAVSGPAGAALATGRARWCLELWLLHPKNRLSCSSTCEGDPPVRSPLLLPPHVPHVSLPCAHGAVCSPLSALLPALVLFRALILLLSSSTERFCAPFPSDVVSGTFSIFQTLSRLLPRVLVMPLWWASSGGHGRSPSPCSQGRTTLRGCQARTCME